MKRFIIAGVAAATLAGGAFALANTMTVTTNSLGAGSHAVSSPACSAAASYTTAWDTTNKVLDVKNVTITATNPSTCGSDNYEFVLQDGSNVKLSDHTGSLTSGTATVDVSGDAVAASAVANISVSITGAL